jgi:hypothetical protein
MPIKLNLLAEAQAEEEQRRRDPVKRLVLAGALLVLLLLVWSSSLQLRVVMARGEVNRLETQIRSLDSNYSAVMAEQKKLTDANSKLAALGSLASNRFLQAPLLNALQQTVLDDVQLTRLRLDQEYDYTAATKGSTNKSVKVPPKPARTTERITLTLEARDTAPNPGDQVARYKEKLAANVYFQELTGPTNELRLANLSTPQGGLGGKPAVNFSLECRLTEKTR